MRKTMELGKVDYSGTGRKAYLAEVQWELKEGRFSMTAGIWNTKHTDCVMCGQCIEEVAKYFPTNKKLQRMVEVWREFHLNDMSAGSPAQRDYLKANPITGKFPENHYDKACAALTEAGLNPDLGYEHNGKPYAYGSAWLKRDIPAEIIAEIEAW